MMQFNQPKIYRIGKITTSDTEIKDLVLGWIAISLAFAVILSPTGFSLSQQFILFFAVAAIGVGSGFIFHELGHKIVAQKYGCFAEFRANYFMLVLAVLMSFFGFVFAAPGAVMIAGGHVDFRRSGKISLAGPLINFILSVVFLGLNFIYPSMIFAYGFTINAWLGLFNMIPFGFFDGMKIFRWSKPVYALAVIAGAALLFLGNSGFLLK